MNLHSGFAWVAEQTHKCTWNITQVAVQKTISTGRLCKLCYHLRLLPLGNQRVRDPCKFDLDQSQPKTLHVHASGGQKASQVVSNGAASKTFFFFLPSLTKRGDVFETFLSCHENEWKKWPGLTLRAEPIFFFYCALSLPWKLKNIKALLAGYPRIRLCPKRENSWPKNRRGRN